MSAHDKASEDPELEELAKEKFGKRYEELDSHEKRQVAGMKGGRHRAHHGSEHEEHEAHHHTAGEGDPELEEIAKEKFGKRYEELDTHEKRAVAGYKGAKHRQQHTAK